MRPFLEACCTALQAAGREQALKPIIRMHQEALSEVHIKQSLLKYVGRVNQLCPSCTLACPTAPCRMRQARGHRPRQPLSTTLCPQPGACLMHGPAKLQRVT